MTSAFHDDSSTALGLSHAARLPGGDHISKLAGPLQQMDRAARELIASNLAADRAKNVAELQRRQGWTRKQAEEFVDTEAAVPKGQRPRLSADERREREVLDLMDARKKTKGGGGSGRSRFKRRKSGTLVCLESHLECKSVDVPCSCAPCRAYESAACHAVGRPAVLNRSSRLSARVSAGAAAILSAACLGASDALEIAAMALESALPYRVAAAAYLAAKPCPACPDKPRGILCVACATVKCGFRPLGASRRRPALSMVSLVIA